MALGRTPEDFWAEADDLPASQPASFADWLESHEIPIDAPVHVLERALRNWHGDQRWHARRAGLHVPPREGDQPRFGSDAQQPDYQGAEEFIKSFFRGDVRGESRGSVVAALTHRYQVPKEEADAFFKRIDSQADAEAKKALDSYAKGDMPRETADAILVDAGYRERDNYLDEARTLWLDHALEKGLISPDSFVEEMVKVGQTQEDARELVRRFAPAGAAASVTPSKQEAPPMAEWQDVTQQRGRSVYWHYALLRDGDTEAKVEQRGYASGNPGYIATISLPSGEVVELYDTRVGTREPFSSKEEAQRGVSRYLEARKPEATNPSGQGTLGDEFATNEQLGMTTGGDKGETQKFDVPASKPAPVRGQASYVEGMGNTETLTAQKEINRNLGRDTDGDGVPDSLDANDDNDGLPDSEDPTPQGPRFRNVPFEQLEIREDLFQRRFPRGLAGGRYTKDEYVRNIADNWDLNQLNAWKVVWNPETGKYTIVGGHHRHDAAKLRMSREQLVGEGDNQVPIQLLEGDITTPEGRAKLETLAIVDNHSMQDVPLSTTIENFNYLIEGPDPSITTPGQAGAKMNLGQREIAELQSLRQLNSAVLFELEQDESLKPYAIELGKRVNTGMFTPLEAAAYWRKEISEPEKRPTLTKYRANMTSIQRAIEDENIKASDMFVGLDEGQFDVEGVRYSDATKALMMKQQRLDEIKEARAEFRGYARQAERLAEAFAEDQIDLPAGRIQENVEAYLRELAQHEERIEAGNLVEPIPKRSPIVAAIADNGKALTDNDGDGQVNAVDWDDDNDMVPDSHDATPHGATGEEVPEMMQNEQARPDDQEEEEQPPRPLAGQQGMFGGKVDETGTLKGDSLEQEAIKAEEISPMVGGVGESVGPAIRDADRKARVKKLLQGGIPINPQDVVRSYGDAAALEALQDPRDAFGMSESEAQAVIAASKGDEPEGYQAMLNAWRQRVMERRQTFMAARGNVSPEPQPEPEESTPPPAPTPEPEAIVAGEPKAHVTATPQPEKFMPVEGMSVAELGRERDTLEDQMRGGIGMTQEQRSRWESLRQEIGTRVAADPQAQAQLSTGSAIPGAAPQGRATAPPVEDNEQVQKVAKAKSEEVEELARYTQDARDLVQRLQEQEQSIQASWEASPAGSEQKERLERERHINSQKLSDAESALNRLENAHARAMQAQSNITKSWQPPPDAESDDAEEAEKGSSFVERARDRFRGDPMRREANQWFRDERKRLRAMRKEMGYNSLTPNDWKYLYQNKLQYEKTGEAPETSNPEPNYPAPANEKDSLANERLSEQARREAMQLDDEFEARRDERFSSQSESRRKDRLSEGEAAEQRSEARAERRFERSQRRADAEAERIERRANARAQRRAASAYGGAPPAPGYGSEDLSPIDALTAGSPFAPEGKGVPTESQAGGWFRRRDAYGRFAPGGTAPAPRKPNTPRPGAPGDAAPEDADTYDDAPHSTAKGTPAAAPQTRAQKGGGSDGQTQTVDVDVVVVGADDGSKHFTRTEEVDEDGDKASIIKDDKGRTRAIGIDADGDGKVESYVLDTDDDGTPDTILITDGKGRAEAVADLQLSVDRTPAGDKVSAQVERDMAMMRDTKGGGLRFAASEKKSDKKSSSGSGRKKVTSPKGTGTGRRRPKGKMYKAMTR